MSDEIRRFFIPLEVFVVGLFMLLLMMLLWDPAIQPQIDDLVTGSAFWSGWGWDWIMTTGVIKWLAFAAGFLTVCFWTGVAFLTTRPKF